MFEEMVRQKLQKFESQLALIWRLWLQVKHFIKLLTASNFRQLPSFFSTAMMFISQKRFTATNHPSHLEAALRRYFSLRHAWLSEEISKKPVILEISGWATANEFHRLRDIFTEFKIRRVFRPDVWYLSSGDLGFYSGFTIQCPVDAIEGILEVVGQAAGGIDSSFSEDPQIFSSDSGSVRFESIVAKRDRGDLGLFSTFVIAPSEFSNLVEATVDKEIASMLLRTLGILYQGGLFGETIRHAAKFCLIIGSVPQDFQLRGWTLCDIASPDWKPSQHISGVTKSKIQAQYFTQTNLEIQNGGTLLHNQVFLNWDTAQHPAKDFVAGNWASVVGSSANLWKCFVKDFEYGVAFQDAIVLSSRVDSNWFHFLIETLPRLFLVDEIIDPDFPILVSERIPSSGLEALRAVTDRKIIQVSTLQRTRIKNAVVPGPVIYHPDTQFLWDQVSEADFNVDLLRALRTKVLNNLAHSNLELNSYWIRPGNHRVLKNPQSVSRLLEKYNFQIDDPGSLDFASQVSLVYASKNLVTVGGAAMANFIFANEGALITVLTSKFGEKYGVPIILGKVSGATIKILPGKRKLHFPLESVISRSHRSFKVRIRALKKSLNSQIKL